MTTIRAIDFTPRPGAAPLGRMVLAQAGMELRVLLRNGEQLLLTLVIPVLLLVLLATTSFVDLGVDGTAARAAFLTPGVLALAVLSTAFTGQAIGTGFERRYGVLKRLGATPLSRFGLLAAKVLAVLAVQGIQVAVLAGVGLALGWRPAPGAAGLAAALLLVAAGTAAFGSLALLMAGTLRAEATLAAANLVYVLLLGLGGVVVPLDAYPEALRAAVAPLPITALAEGMRDALGGGPFPLAQLAVLACWAALGGALAARFFRWE
ncbi:ABC transporter permease [Allonocardiopsis opalescens]|uniref:Transport permease protein n=1 Tax=Allonocardiopsis opalescens TaxID=1144618 RepID=A0A2T0PUQ0_9ACTN|nr:ABC transporter permease [Allonocardiopsis opalescens]PRX92528.1 ABC-2 type transport system permease protein [Allonocardiopsis opalescens]